MSERHVTPTDHEIRQRVLEVSNEQRRVGFMAQYLWLGRVAEVFGKYMPKRDSFRLTEFDGEEAVMFFVRTAKRDGMYRPVALPLDKKYEPWTEVVYEYMAGCTQEYPFALSGNHETSKKYAMNAARKALKGLWYPYADYTRGVPEPYTQDMVVDKGYNKKGYDEWIVELPDGRRGRTTDRETVIMNVPVNFRWKRATSHLFRKHRNDLLKYTYRFDGTDRSIIGGWTEKSQDSDVADAQKFYTFQDLSELSPSVMGVLKRQADRYFHKLLIPYNKLI